jgi:hypothetical protein
VSFAAQSKGNKGQTKLFPDESGSEKLHGALKEAPRVKPRRNNESHRKQSFSTQFRRADKGKTEAAQLS